MNTGRTDWTKVEAIYRKYVAEIKASKQSGPIVEYALAVIEQSTREALATLEAHKQELLGKRQVWFREV